ncbi:MAG: glycosyltransferase family 4 protein [Acidobacteriota bacterium]
MKVRIALLSNYPVDPSRISGGVKAVAFHLAHGLGQFEDLDLHILHCHSDVPTDRTVRDGRITIHYLSRPKRRVIPNMITGVAQLTRKLRTLQPDLANAHTGQYAFAALRAGVQTVYTIHGVAHRELRCAANWKQALELAVTSCFARSAIKRVDEVISISPHIEREYRNRTAARFHRIDNPVGDEYFQAQGREVRGRVLFAGSISPRKRPLLLVEALRKVVSPAPDAHIHMAGQPADGAYLLRLKRHIADCRLQEQVSYLGSLDRPEMLREYAQCALLALPSLVETAPVSILEAMASGKPVVATSVGGVPDLVEDGVTGFLVAPNDSASLANRILCLLKDDALRANMGRRAREVALRRFQRDRVAARYHKIYQDVLCATRLAP